MRVKILKCSEPHWWYVDQIGEMFQIKPFMDGGNYVVNDGTDVETEKQLLINPGDCSISPDE